VPEDLRLVVVDEGDESDKAPVEEEGQDPGGRSEEGEGDENEGWWDSTWSGGVTPRLRKHCR
jgi:hypothetical protein